MVLWFVAGVASLDDVFSVEEGFVGRVDIQRYMALAEDVGWQGQQDFLTYHTRARQPKFPVRCQGRVCLQVVDVYYDWRRAVPISRQIACLSSTGCKVYVMQQAKECSSVSPAPHHPLDFTTLLPGFGLHFARAGCLKSDPRIVASLATNLTAVMWFKPLRVAFRCILVYEGSLASNQTLTLSFPASTPQGTLDGVHGLWKFEMTGRPRLASFPQ